MAALAGIDTVKGDILNAINQSLVQQSEHMVGTGIIQFQRKIPGPSIGLRSVEIEWLSSNERDLSSYEGQWIAIKGNEILACGSDEVEVEMRAREKGKVPLLVRIPSKDDIPFVGSNLYDSNNIR